MFLLIGKRQRRIMLFSLAAVIAAVVLGAVFVSGGSHMYAVNQQGAQYIKWVDFNVPMSLMKKTMKLDIDSHNSDEAVKLSWIDILAYLAAKYGGNFSRHKDAALDKLVKSLRDGESIEDLSSGMKHFAYYREAYGAVLGGFVGEYERQGENGEWEKRYGLKVFSPIAKGYEYSDFDDFGTGRNYGYKRKHLGHDLMALTGVPVIAVESGVVEVMGWNQYGGWRVGIRSFDGRRYYYYAHLRQNRPFAEGLAAGQVVMAGDVIGYVGRTGYSANENVNGIKQSHLHYGLQLIFDESQKEGVNQIWIDLYDITRMLSSNRSQTVRDPDTKEHTRAVKTRETVPENRFVPSDSPPEEPGNEDADAPEG